MSSKCPKCGKKLSPFYLKQTCPQCGVNLLYYRLDERLREDAANAQREVEAVRRFTGLLRASSIGSPLHIFRLVLFFTPLASMCLPMYHAGSKQVSLIGFILSVINHGLHIDAWSSDYRYAVLAMTAVIVLSLAVIIGSLFSAAKNGGIRNIILSLVNTAVFGALSVLVCTEGGSVGIGFYVTMAIYGVEFLLHYFCDSDKKSAVRGGGLFSPMLCLVLALGCGLMPKTQQSYTRIEKTSAAVRTVSFNTAAPWGTPFDGTAGADRAVRFADTVKSCQPDFIGTQELTADWLERMKTLLPDYDSYAVRRGGDDSEAHSEMNGIFWLKARYTALETATFWLSDTPDTESRYTYTDETGAQQEAGCNRICSYAVLQNTDGKRFAFFNTHLDNASEEARQYGARLILERIEKVKAQYADIAVVLSGDFNQTADSEVYRLLTASLTDTAEPQAVQATWQDWGYSDTGDQPIDFIFTNGTAEDYQVLDETPYGYVSDHYGIMADIVF